MDERCAVTAVLITFNRARLLGSAIDAVLAQTDASPFFELIVVDNNSTDDTRAVVESRMTGANGRLRYVFERRQGIPFARNAGIANARAPLVAFTDDDVRVSDRWIQEIEQSFDLHPSVDCVSGPILPVWEAPPPAWLTERHWVGPLALQDYGDKPLLFDATRPLSLAGANLAFRRQVFHAIGGFSSEFSRAEDSAFLLRFWQAGCRALYNPGMAVHALVQAERLTKTYHRAWHVHTGSLTRLAEELSATQTTRLAPLTRIFGWPCFAFAELAAETRSWLSHLVRGRDADAFWHEGQMREIVAYMAASRAGHGRSRRELSSSLSAETVPASSGQPKMR